VLELGADRDFIRVVARRLAEDGPESARIRAAISRAISGDAPTKGGISMRCVGRRLSAPN